MAVVESIPRVTHIGSLKFGDIKIPCAVLSDGMRVVSENGITNAILGSRSGASKRLKKAGTGSGAPVPLFLAPKVLEQFIDKDLYDGPLRLLEYRGKTGSRINKGYDARLLPIVCEAWLRAREADLLQEQQLDKAFKAEILMRALAHIGIIALVDEATGYQEERDRGELQRIFDEYLLPFFAPWAKKFPEEFYRELFRLHGWQYSPLSVKRPQLVARRTNELIYDRLPPGVKEELQRRNPRDERTKRRKHKHFQLLTDHTGIPHLDKMLAIATAFMQIAPNYRKFLGMYNRVVPKPGTTRLIPFPDRDFDAVEI